MCSSNTAEAQGLGDHLNHLQLLYIRVEQLKASFLCVHKTSLLHGTTAILGSSGRTIPVMLRGVKKIT